MKVQFASCQRNYVLDFIKKGYPNSVVTAEKLPKLMIGIEKDIVRITDPDYHQLAIVPGKNFQESNLTEMKEIVNEIRNLLANDLAKYY